MSAENCRLQNLIVVWVDAFVRVQINQDRTLNFSDLITKFSTNAPPANPKPSKPLALRVYRLRILQTGTVEPERLFLTESHTGGVKAQGARTYLQFR